MYIHKDERLDKVIGNDGSVDHYESNEFNTGFVLYSYVLLPDLAKLNKLAWIILQGLNRAKLFYE